MITEIFMSYYLDIKRLAELVRFHRGDCSLREIAKITSAIAPEFSATRFAVISNIGL